MKFRGQKVQHGLGGLFAAAAVLAAGFQPYISAFAQNAGAAMIEAEVINPGVNCPRVRLAGGEEISLMGFSRTIAPGTRVQLAGDFVLRSNCQQGRTFHVTSFVIVTP